MSSPEKFEPGSSLSGESLQQEAVAAEDARAQRLLKADANLYLRSGTEKAVTVNHVFVSRRDFNRHDVARQFSGEGQFTAWTDGPIFSHENGPSASYPFQHAEQATAPGVLGVRGHLNRTTHPRQFSCFGKN